jgi:hypothetical protein
MEAESALSNLFIAPSIPPNFSRMSKAKLFERNDDRHNVTQFNDTRHTEAVFLVVCDPSMNEL